MLIKANGPESNKFHKFQQKTKQGKEMYNVRQTGNKRWLQISNVL